MPDGNDVTEKVQKATKDAGTFTTGDAEKTYTALMTHIDTVRKEAKDDQWSENAKSAYNQTFSQALVRSGVIPELAITNLDQNKNIPKSATGDITETGAPVVKDKPQDLAQELKRLTGLTNKDPFTAVERLLLRAAMTPKFAEYAKAADAAGDTTPHSRISKADLQELLNKQPKRNP